MIRRFAAAALATLVITSGPAVAAPADNPPAPPPSEEKGKKGGKATDQKQKNSEQEFRDGYRRAHELILKGDYVAGIPALHALGYDDHPDVANYLGYAHRKIGSYAEARHWYPRACRRPAARAHMVVLRHVARRAGQYRPRRRLPRQGPHDLRE
jgi:TPR repeat protein